MKTPTFQLRHTYGPYAFRLILLSSLNIFFFYFWITADQPAPAIVGLLALMYFLAKSYYYDMRYAVTVTASEIVMHPAHLWHSPRDVKAIRFSDITSVQRESSDLPTLLAADRPTRRLSIYANSAGSQNVIDVSLKHFDSADIRSLLDRIRELRPDVSVPSI